MPDATSGLLAEKSQLLTRHYNDVPTHGVDVKLLLDSEKNASERHRIPSRQVVKHCIRAQWLYFSL